MGMPETIAIKWLRTTGVEFEELPYEFTQIGADHAARAVNKPLEMVCKTLIVEASGKHYYVAIVPGDQRFNPKLMAQVIGAKQADIADTRLAEKITGYQVGGISPFATRRKLPVIIEESLLALERIIVNAGRRGLLVELNTEDLIRLLKASPGAICR